VCRPGNCRRASETDEREAATEPAGTGSGKQLRASHGSQRARVVICGPVDTAFRYRGMTWIYDGVAVPVTRPAEAVAPMAREHAAISPDREIDNGPSPDSRPDRATLALDGDRAASAVLAFATCVAVESSDTIRHDEGKIRGMETLCAGNGRNGCCRGRRWRCRFGNRPRRTSRSNVHQSWDDV
jgi:hypothetical protein